MNSKNQVEFLDDIKNDPKIDIAVGGIRSINFIKLHSSHRIFLKILSKDGQYFICKKILDTALSSLDNCVLYEFRALFIVSPHGFAPKPIYVDESKKLIIEEYIQNVPYDQFSIDSIEAMANMAKILMGIQFNSKLFKEVHISYKDDFSSHLRLLEEAKKIDIKLFEDYLILDKLFHIGRNFCFDLNSKLKNIPKVLSHNDLVYKNILKRPDGTFCMIDFETVAISNLDFLIGQLAIDTEIDWFVCKNKSIDVFQVKNIVENRLLLKISDELFLARIIERLIQNSVYSLRQIARRKIAQHPKKYVNHKVVFLNFCIDKLQLLFSKINL